MENRLEEDGERAFPGEGHTRDEKLYQIKRENTRLREENVIHQKAVGIFSQK